MFNFALGVFLFLSPIFFLFGNNARINGIFGALQYYQFRTLSNTSDILQFQFFQYGILALFIIALAYKPEREFHDRNFSWLLGLCALGIFLHPKNFSAFLPIFLGSLLYYLVVKYTRKISPFLWIVTGVAILNTIFALLQFFNINLFYGTAGGIKGLMCISNQLGFYQAVSLPICYFLNPYLAIIPLIGIILSKSYLALGAGLVGMIYLLIPKISKLKVSLIYIQVFINLLILFFIFNYKNIVYKLTVRNFVWMDTWKSIQNHFIFGSGIGYFKFDKPLLGTYNNPYSIYLQIILFFGIAGLLCFLFFIYDKFLFFAKRETRALTASMLVFLIIGIGFCFMDFPRLAGTAIVLFGLLTVAKGEKNVDTL